MPNIGKDDHPKPWSLIFVLIIALTFCCFVMGQGLNSGTSVFLAGQGYGASLALLSTTASAHSLSSPASLSS